MAHQANLPPVGEESQPGRRPAPKAAVGVKIVGGIVLLGLSLAALAIWALARALG
jgi:hypothetical protein